MEENDKALALSGLIFHELMQFARFTEFVKLNYQIITEVDKDEGTIDVRVIEEDSDHVRQRIAEAMQAKMSEDVDGIVTAPASALGNLGKK